MVVDRQQARRTCAAWGFATTGWLALSLAAAQQATASAASASDLTSAERVAARRGQGFTRILIHADKPRKPNPDRDEKRVERRDGMPLAAIRAKPAARAAEASPPAASPALLTVENKPDAAPVARPAPAAVIQTSLAVVEARGVVERNVDACGRGRRGDRRKP